MANKYIDGVRWVSAGNGPGEWESALGSIIGDGKGWWAGPVDQSIGRSGPFPTMTRAAQWLKEEHDRLAKE